jgi:hypothetical protein
VSDEEEKDIDDVVNLTEDKYSAQSLDKMITLVAVLVEKSRADKHLRLSDKDIQAITGGGKVIGGEFIQVASCTILLQLMLARFLLVNYDVEVCDGKLFQNIV